MVERNVLVLNLRLFLAATGVMIGPLLNAKDAREPSVQGLIMLSMDRHVNISILFSVTKTERRLPV